MYVPIKAHEIAIKSSINFAKEISELETYRAERAASTRHPPHQQKPAPLKKRKKYNARRISKQKEKPEPDFSRLRGHPRKTGNGRCRTEAATGQAFPQESSELPGSSPRRPLVLNTSQGYWLGDVVMTHVKISKYNAEATLSIFWLFGLVLLGVLWLYFNNNVWQRPLTRMVMSGIIFVVWGAGVLNCSVCTLSSIIPRCLCVCYLM